MLPAVELITEGDVFYAKALRAILAAKQHVLFMIYIWQDDEIGRLIERALILKARRGVTVQLVIDAVGSFELSSACRNRLRAGGVEVYMHHRLKLLRFSWFRYLIRRNHRKIIIVDDDVGFTGGFNLMRECSLKFYGETRWLDMMAMTRDQKIIVLLKQQYLDACRRARHEKWSARLLTRSGNKAIIAAGSRVAAVSMSRYLKHHLRAAKHRIVIVVPYFIPYGFFWRILLKKLKAGIQIEIMLSQKSDLP